MKTTFFRVLHEESKATSLLNAIKSDHAALRYQIEPTSFRAIPTTPFAYWYPRSIFEVFQHAVPFEAEQRMAKHGGVTLNDFRFVRLAWEVRPTLDTTADPPFAKGGKAIYFYADTSTTLRWLSGGAELKAYVAAIREQNGWSPHWTAVLNGHEFYFRPGVTWPLRAASFTPRALPRGSIFSQRGQSAFAPEEDLTWIMAVLSSRSFDLLYKARVGRGGHPEFVVGVLKDVPFPSRPPTHVRDELSSLARAAWSLTRSLDTTTEVSHAFVMPAALQVEGLDLESRVAAWAERISGVEAELERVQFEIDEVCFDLYGISVEERQAIAEGFDVSDNEDDGGEEGDEDDAGVEAVQLDSAGLAAGLVSWAVGVAVGRFDVRLATGEREWPPEPDPFDPLPVCSPGMLTGADGLPLPGPSEDYPVEVSPVLVDDPGHELDITGRVRSVFDTVFGAHADRWWAEVGTALGARGCEVASWLSKGYFDHHLKIHSKSRRKAPILWPLGTASGSYLVWLYTHRVSGDSLFRMLNDVVSPKLALERRRMTDLVQEAGPNPTAGQRKAIDAQAKLVDELQDLAQQLNAVAPLWYPDINDGVLIVLAPLWRLFAHHRAWSRELRKHWDKLRAGDYDWAQLAMRLWPERVVPRCAEDRSLAIAHGLEDVFWVQDDNNPDKWHTRETPTTPIDQLVAQRTNPTTKATLQGRT
jgi:hypothetical protein